VIAVEGAGSRGVEDAAGAGQGADVAVEEEEARVMARELCVCSCENQLDPLVLWAGISGMVEKAYGVNAGLFARCWRVPIELNLCVRTIFRIVSRYPLYCAAPLTISHRTYSPAAEDSCVPSFRPTDHTVKNLTSGDPTNHGAMNFFNPRYPRSLPLCPGLLRPLHVAETRRAL